MSSQDVDDVHDTQPSDDHLTIEAIFSKGVQYSTQSRESEKINSTRDQIVIGSVWNRLQRLMHMLTTDSSYTEDIKDFLQNGSYSTRILPYLRRQSLFNLTLCMVTFIYFALLYLTCYRRRLRTPTIQEWLKLPGNHRLALHPTSLVKIGHQGYIKLSTFTLTLKT